MSQIKKKSFVLKFSDNKTEQKYFKKHQKLFFKAQVNILMIVSIMKSLCYLITSFLEKPQNSLEFKIVSTALFCYNIIACLLIKKYKSKKYVYIFLVFEILETANLMENFVIPNIERLTPVNLFCLGFIKFFSIEMFIISARNYPIDIVFMWIIILYKNLRVLGVRNMFIDIFALIEYTYMLMYTKLQYNKEYRDRVQYQKYIQERRTLKIWKDIVNKIIPTGYIIIGTKNEKIEDSLSRNLTGIRKSLNQEAEILFINKFVQNVLNLEKGEDILNLIEKIAIDTNKTEDAKVSQLEIASPMRKEFVKLGDILLRELRKISLRSTKSFSDNPHLIDEYILAEFSSTTLKINGVEKNFDISLLKIVWKEGREGILILMKDISDRLLSQRLRTLDNYKDLLLASVSHELKTPLNSIMGVTSLMQARYSDPEISQFLHQIKINSDLLLNEINDILDYSQINKGKMRLNISEFNLSQLIDEALMLFRLTASEKNIDVRCLCEKEFKLSSDPIRLKQILINLIGNSLKFTFEGSITIEVGKSLDEKIYFFTITDTGIGMSSETQNRLFRVFGTYDESPGVNQHGIGLGLTISKQLVGILGPKDIIEVQSEVGKGSMFSFQIYQNMERLPFRSRTEISHKKFSLVSSIEPESHKKNIKERSYLASRQKPKKKRKTLLGYFLSLFSKGSSTSPKRPDFTYQQDNSAMHSSMNKGILCLETSNANFNQDLEYLENVKINIVYPTDNLNHFPKEGKGIDLHKQASSFRVLIVDDTPFNLLVIENFLKSIQDAEITLEKAYNGLQAIEKVKENSNFDIIFMDCNMPVMNGYEASLELKKMMNEGLIGSIPILAISAYTGENERLKCLESGMDDYLAKPLRQDQFLAYFYKWTINKGLV